MLDLNSTAIDAFRDEIHKIADAASKISKIPWKSVRKAIPWVGGAVGFKVMSDAEKDRRLGHQFRAQKR